MPAIAVAVSGLVLGASPKAAEHPSALQSLAGLPADAQARVVAIVGWEGSPAPDRWRILVSDANAENGFREHIVQDGKLAKTNLVSQFASRVTPQDVLPQGSLEIDSDKAAWLALQYAKANQLPVTTLNFALRRPTDLAMPVWKVDCFDAAQQQVGSISIAATGGKVLTHLGFEKTPTATGAVASTSENASKRKASPKPKSARPKSTPAPRVANVTPAEAVAEQPIVEEPVPVRRARPAGGERREGPISRALGSIFRDDNND